jgi:acyl dehydratase
VTTAPQPTFETVSVGDEIPATTYPVTRFDLIKYAGASGDFNVIHWNERIATMVGLPNVIAHGMFTMATAGRLVTDWIGDPGAVIEYGVRFTSMVVVPDDDKGANIQVSGKVTSKDDAARTAVVELTATSNGTKVLGKARATVQLP